MKVNADIEEKLELRTSSSLNLSVNRININSINSIISSNGNFSFRIPNDNSVYKAQSKYVKVDDINNYEWQGEVVDRQNINVGTVSLAEVEGALFGNINVGERSFVIEDLGKSLTSKNGNRISILIEKNNELTKGYRCANHNTDHDGMKGNSEGTSYQRNFSCPRNVRVLVLFTTAANNIQDGNQAAITYINQANQALRNSGINAEQLTFDLADAQLFNGVSDQIDRANPNSLTPGADNIIAMRDAIAQNTIALRISEIMKMQT